MRTKTYRPDLISLYSFLLVYAVGKKDTRRELATYAFLVFQDHLDTSNEHKIHGILIMNIYFLHDMMTNFDQIPGILTAFTDL